MADRYNLGNVGGIYTKCLLDEIITTTGTYYLADSVYNYNYIIVEFQYSGYHSQSNTFYIGKDPANVAQSETGQFIVVYGNGSTNSYTHIGFDTQGNLLINKINGKTYVTRIIGVK